MKIGDRGADSEVETATCFQEDVVTAESKIIEVELESGDPKSRLVEEDPAQSGEELNVWAQVGRESRKNMREEDRFFIGAGCCSIAEFDVEEGDPGAGAQVAVDWTEERAFQFSIEGDRHDLEVSAQGGNDGAPLSGRRRGLPHDGHVVAHNISEDVVELGPADLNENRRIEPGNFPREIEAKVAIPERDLVVGEVAAPPTCKPIPERIIGWGEAAFGQPPLFRHAGAES